MASLIGRLKGGAFWGAVSQGGVGIFSIATGAILARTLNAEDLGFFFLALPLIRFLAVVAGFGLPEGVQKLVGIAVDGGGWGAVRDLIYRSTALFAFAAVLVGLVFMTVWPVLDAEVFGGRLSITIGVVILATAVLRAFEQTGAAFFRAVRRLKLGLFFVGTPRELLFAAVLLTGWAVFGKFWIDGVLYAYLSVSVVIAVALFVLIFRFVYAHAATEGRGEAPSLGNCAALCLPVMVHTSLVVLFSSIDIWVLGLYRSAEEVAVYGAVLRLVILIPFPLYVLNMVLPAMVAALHHKGEIRKLTMLARTAATWSFLLGAIVVVIFVVLGRSILGGVFGPAFEGGWVVLAILSLGQLINAACGSPGVVLQMTGFQTLLMKITLATTAFNLAANLAVVGSYGAIGVATVTAASMIVQNAAMTYFAHRKTGVLTLPHPAMLRPRYLRRLLER